MQTCISKQNFTDVANYSHIQRLMSNLQNHFLVIIQISVIIIKGCKILLLMMKRPPYKFLLLISKDHKKRCKMHLRCILFLYLNYFRLRQIWFNNYLISHFAIARPIIPRIISNPPIKASMLSQKGVSNELL